MVYKTIRPQAETIEDHRNLAESCNDGPEHAHNTRTEKPDTDGPGPSQQQHSERKAEGVKSHMRPLRKGPDRQKKRIFGLAQEKYHNSQTLLDDYEARYPPDQIGREMGPNARVWRVYLDEAELNDRDMVEGWKDGIDVLLVFAGLFSAVVTTFVTQTSQKLDQDYGPISASLLAEVVAIQRTIAAGGPVSEVPAANPSLSSPPHYTKTDVWVNALWFISLILSLVTALSAVLIKQWIQHYVSFVSGTAQERARIHQFRYAGLEKWGVRGIMSVLPVLLYAALFLFIFGLVIFLNALKGEIAIVVGVIGGITFLLYVVTNGLPLIYPQCPYYTPLIDLLHTATNLAIFAYRQTSFYIIYRAIPQFLSHPTIAYLCTRFGKQPQQRRRRRNPPKYKPAGHKLSESQAAILDQDKLTMDIITWLLTMSSNPSIKPIALQSISGLRPGFSCIPEFLGQGSPVREELYNEFERQEIICGIKLPRDDPVALIDSPLFCNAERTLRACFFVPNRWKGGWIRNIWRPDNWNEFDEAVTNAGDNIPLSFKQALATYRTYFWRDFGKPALTIISPVSSLVDTAKDNPALWHAWSSNFQNRDHDDWVPHSILEAYHYFGHLFRELLLGDNFDSILLFLRQVLPPGLVKDYLDHPLEQGFTAEQELKIKRLRFIDMVLRGVVEEWNEDQRFGRNPRTEIEALILDILGFYSLDISPWRSLLARVSYAGTAGEATIRGFLTALDELSTHPRFTLSHLKSSTYSQIFNVYYLAHPYSADEFPTTSILFSSPEHIHTILATQDCVYGLWDALFKGQRHSQAHRSYFASQVVAVLEGQGVSDQTAVQYAFDAFPELDSAAQYLTQKTFATDSSLQWPASVQPIVRWTLDYLMTHSGTDHHRASVDALAASLIERPGFLAFTCSSFLFHCDHVDPLLVKITVSKESDVLLRLAEYHKDKPGAADAWHHFLTWVQGRSKEVHRDKERGIRADWKRDDFAMYGRMADLVDQLASRLGFDDLSFKVPRFEESYVTEFLRSQWGTPGTPKSEAASSLSIDKPWSLLFQKLLHWGGRSDPDSVAGNVDLESNQNKQDN